VSRSPESWRTSRLGDVAEIVRGVTYKKTQAQTSEGDGLVPLLRATNVAAGRLQIGDDLIWVPIDVVKPVQYLRAGDIVVATSSGSPTVVGKSAPFSSHTRPVTFGAFCGVIRSGPEIDSGFLSWYLRSEAVRRQWRDLASGTSINNLKRDHMTSLPIPAPPLEEQKRIAQTIEDLFSRIEAASGSLAEATARARGLFGKALDGLFDDGRLRWKSLGDVASISAKLVDPVDHPDLPHVAPNHIESKTGRLHGVRTVFEDGVTSSKYQFNEGDVLYSKIRPYLAKVVVAPFEGLCSADMYPLETTLGAEYLARWMLSPRFTSLASGQQGRSVLPKINREALFRLPVPDAAPDVQGELVDRFDQLDTRLGHVLAVAEAAAARAAALRSSILSAAFSGKLTLKETISV
jgi:type I restriction enzyme S subunit